MSDLFYTDQGTGPVVVVLHGLFGSSTNWRACVRQLAEDHRVIAVDLRNHGRSPHVNNMSYPGMVADLISLLDKLELDAAAVIGHSMGGKAAMLWSLTYPQRVSRLVVVDIAPVPYRHDHLGFIQAMLNLNLDTLKSRADADRRLAGDVPDVGTRLFLLQNLVSERDRFRWRLNLKALRRHMDDIMGFPDPGDRSYPGPALFIAGEQSDYIAPGHHSLIANWFPEARHVSIPGAGHWVHADAPQLLVDAIRDFGL